MIVDAEGQGVALDWVYKNQDGQMSNQHVLEKPYGDKPLEDVTTFVALKWLNDQLPNTAEEFDVAIAKYKERKNMHRVSVLTPLTHVQHQQSWRNISTMPADV